MAIGESVDRLRLCTAKQATHKIQGLWDECEAWHLDFSHPCFAYSVSWSDSTNRAVGRPLYHRIEGRDRPAGRWDRRHRTEKQTTHEIEGLWEEREARRWAFSHPRFTQSPRGRRWGRGPGLDADRAGARCVAYGISSAPPGMPRSSSRMLARSREPCNTRTTSMPSGTVR